MKRISLLLLMVLCVVVAGTFSSVNYASAAETKNYNVNVPSGISSKLRLTSFTATEDGIATVKGYQSSSSKPFSTYYVVTERNADIVLVPVSGNTSVSFDFPVESGKTYIVQVMRTQIDLRNGYSVNGNITYP